METSLSQQLKQTVQTLKNNSLTKREYKDAKKQFEQFIKEKLAQKEQENLMAMLI